MSRESFADALRIELAAVVTRYEALVKAHAEALSLERDRKEEELRGEIAALKAEVERLRAGESEGQGVTAKLRAQVDELTAELGRAREEAAQERKKAAEAAARAETATEAAQALEGTFVAEKRFAEACRGLEGSLLMEAIRGALGRDIDATPATLAALKARGLELLLTQSVKERGRSAPAAPLLERERAALPGLAASAGCELFTPQAGTRFSAASMDKASTVSDPAEEGNVVECLVPGIRLAGTEGALVFPRVVVAAG